MMHFQGDEGPWNVLYYGYAPAGRANPPDAHTATRRCTQAMRYHIDTIPLWDAMKLDGECLLCALERKTELGEAERYLGASVMEPDVRVQVNDKGFCRHHQAMLFVGENRLGHALMLESHMIETRDRVKKPFHELRKAAHAYADASLMDRVTSKGQAARRKLTEQAGELAKLSHTCIMCDSIAENMARYRRTFFHLYKTDTEFRQAFATGKGLCLPHAAQLLEEAPEKLSPKELADFADTLCELETRNLDRMQEDISWFIKKYDYRFGDEPWKNSRDAVERTVNKLRGWCVGKEPNPEEKPGF